MLGTLTDLGPSKRWCSKVVLFIVKHKAAAAHKGPIVWGIALYLV